jgi:hypothetical protein
MKVSLNSNVELHKMKQTLKITIYPTQPKGIAYKLKPKTNAPPTFSHGKKRWGKGGVY